MNRRICLYELYNLFDDMTWMPRHDYHGSSSDWIRTEVDPTRIEMRAHQVAAVGHQS